MYTNYTTQHHPSLRWDHHCKHESDWCRSLLARAVQDAPRSLLLNEWSPALYVPVFITVLLTRMRCRADQFSPSDRMYLYRPSTILMHIRLRLSICPLVPQVIPARTRLPTGNSGLHRMVWTVCGPAPSSTVSGMCFRPSTCSALGTCFACKAEPGGPLAFACLVLFVDFQCKFFKKLQNQSFRMAAKSVFQLLLHSTPW